MATALVPTTPGDPWNALFVTWPEVYRVHRCWTSECPAGSHDEAPADSEAA